MRDSIQSMTLKVLFPTHENTDNCIVKTKYGVTPSKLKSSNLPLE